MEGQCADHAPRGCGSRQAGLRPLRRDQSLAQEGLPGNEDFPSLICLDLELIESIDARVRPSCSQQEPGELPPRRRTSRLLSRQHGPWDRGFTRSPPSIQNVLLPRRPISPYRRESPPGARQLPIHERIVLELEFRWSHAHRCQSRGQAAICTQQLCSQVSSRYCRGALPGIG